MIARHWLGFSLVLLCLLHTSEASPGDAHPVYRSCVTVCERDGCIGKTCFADCNYSSHGASHDSPWYTQEPLYQRWKQWGCESECRFLHACQRRRESKTRLWSTQIPWKMALQACLRHSACIFIDMSFFLQEVASVVFSALNLYAHIHGWLSLIILLYYKLPLRYDKKTYYEYTPLWHIYGLLSCNSWFWSIIFHSRDVALTEKLDYSSVVALIGYSLILSILRSFNIKEEASRVMVAAPLLAFITTHILYLNFYQMDYGWNIIVCVAMGIVQLLTWAIWAGVSRHPSRWKVWVPVIGGGLAMLLEIYDFPPYKGYFDAHSIWHATTIPLTYVWWSFIRDDAELATSYLLKKSK
ncbi:unnamed protein product [Linum tenue]|uniref:Post-GPI attachment to proteins factor 3 n=1 Tax=Linum tenue TaxID=586396 RepID=A0AAV0MVT4_9ROSI|nr:unnamed protein product [Linum tenue]